MEFDNQIAIPIILAFAAFFSLLPLVIIGTIDTKLCVGIFIFGLITIPLNALLITGFNDTTFINAITLKFSGSSRGIMMSYWLTFLGFPLVIISFLRNLVRKTSKNSTQTDTESHPQRDNNASDR